MPKIDLPDWVDVSDPQHSILGGGLGAYRVAIRNGCPAGNLVIGMRCARDAFEVKP